LTGFGLFHNHLSIDLVRPVFKFGTPQFFKLVHRVRLAVLEDAAREGANLIFTYVYIHPEDSPFVDQVFGTIRGNGGRICPVQLTCDVRVLRERVGLPSRVEQRKLRTAESLNEFLDHCNAFEPIPQAQSLRINTSNLPPTQAAEEIM